MKIDINKKYERYFTNDEPVPYMPRILEKRYNFLIKEIQEIENMSFRTETLNNHLENYKSELKLIKPILIYPVCTKDYIDFNYGVNCLLLEKNKIPDPKIISMSYLDFLLYLIKYDENGSMYSDMLATIIDLSLHVKDIRFIIDEKNIGKLILDNIELDRKDFENIKEIICYQNMPHYNNKYIDPELEKAIQEANELKNKNQGSVTFEDQKICIMISTSLKLEDIDRLTIRKFEKTLQKVDAKLHYQIYMTGSSWDKANLTNWMYTKDNKFDSLIEYNSFKEKMKHTT